MLHRGSKVRSSRHFAGFCKTFSFLPPPCCSAYLGWRVIAEKMHVHAHLLLHSERWRASSLMLAHVRNADSLESCCHALSRWLLHCWGMYNRITYSYGVRNRCLLRRCEFVHLLLRDLHQSTDVTGTPPLPVPRFPPPSIVSYWTSQEALPTENLPN